eukprot:TRINITY_DN93027_c0_g1_i1.p1 TRINITY_DN93027_c0_g1~~TRINITY_DN93027_c0_g1_i1.p1  ORF type:complete len:739 (-),score=133.97 TRINITY_DN93027_c0_g1_i1:109-2325(-)
MVSNDTGDAFLLRWRQLVTVARAEKRLGVQAELEASQEVVVAQKRFSGCGSTALRLCELAGAYQELYKLDREGEVRVPLALRTTSRYVRDALVTSCRASMVKLTREDFLDLLDTAFGGELSAGLSAKDVDSENLVSQMLQAWNFLFGPFSSASTKRRRVPRKRKTSKKGSENVSAPPTAEYPCWPFWVSSAWAPWWPLPWTSDQGLDPVSGVFYPPGFDPQPDLCAEPECPVDDSADAEQNLEAEPSDIISIPGTDLSGRYMHRPLDEASIPDTHNSWEALPPRQNKAKAPTLASIEDDKSSSVDDGFDDGVDGDYDVCADCQAEDSYGWADRRQQFYCYRCWEVYNAQWGPEKVDCGLEGPERPERYEKLDPVAIPAEQRSCEVVVHDADALSTMQLLREGSTCLVVLGSEIVLPMPSETRYQCQNFFERTNFKELFKSSEPVPRWGALYAPRIAVSRNKSLGPLSKPFEIPAMYAATPWGPSSNDDWPRFRREMKEKIQNILRICSKHCHDDIVVCMARSSFASQPVAVVTSLWRECLLTTGDTPGLVRRVVFAMPEHVALKVHLAFEQEFEDPLSKIHSEIHGEPKMIVSAGTTFCVDARLHIHKTEGLSRNGIAVGLWEASVTAAQEHQMWLHLPCGRLALSAFPSLLLTAELSRSGAKVHLSLRAEDDTHLQTWSVDSDGHIFLTEHPQLLLTAKDADWSARAEDSDDSDLQLFLTAKEESSGVKRVWEMLQR